MEAVAPRNKVALRDEVHQRIDNLPDDKLPTLISFIKNMDGELTLDGKTLDDLSPEFREVFERRNDPTFWSPAFKTAEEATAWALSHGDDDEE